MSTSIAIGGGHLRKAGIVLLAGLLTIASLDAIAATQQASETTTEQRFSTRALSEGEFFWGVFAVRDGQRIPLFKEARKLTIKRHLGIKTPTKVTFD